MGFKDFLQAASEAFPGVDFSYIKLPIAVESSLLLLPAISEEINIEDNAITSLPPKDDAKFGNVVPSDLP